MRALYLTLPPPTYLILLTTLHMLPFVITIINSHQLPRHAGFALFGLFPSSAIISPEMHTHIYTHTLLHDTLLGNRPSLASRLSSSRMRMPRESPALENVVLHAFSFHAGMHAFFSSHRRAVWPGGISYPLPPKVLGTLLCYVASLRRSLAISLLHCPIGVELHPLSLSLVLSN
ncbi:hypothetical protein H0G86_008650 [Trichoderma simmonsii]|uniref:Uncharacterized protein n=1 Tax=Trichoderma simmonsii TaxID=1491479 RepID=A0A8G0LFY8_9HYPO|nr:hypothetical protein H0G86_008650 [Trichoderma simmonsii]